MRSVWVMAVYAAALVGGGVFAFLKAPPGANAATALIVPGACAAVMIALAAVVASTWRTNLKAARRAHLAAVILALAFASAFASRATAANKASNEFKQATFAYDLAVQGGQAEATPEGKRAFFGDFAYRAAEGARSAKAPPGEPAPPLDREQFLRDYKAPTHDKTYLANTLWALMFVSAGAFLALLVTRPGNPARGAGGGA